MKPDPIALRLIERYALKPHPEGGYYAETYRSKASTAIFFLLTEGARSSLHRIASDEVWHFHLGGPLVIIELAAGGQLRRTRLGPAVEQGETLQHVVPAGTWFGAYPYPGTRYALVGCTVAPPFEFSSFELAKRSDVLPGWPDARAEIEKLTPP